MIFFIIYFGQNDSLPFMYLYGKLVYANLLIVFSSANENKVIKVHLEKQRRSPSVSTRSRLPMYNGEDVSAFNTFMSRYTSCLPGILYGQQLKNHKQTKLPPQQFIFIPY